MGSLEIIHWRDHFLANIRALEARLSELERVAQTMGNRLPAGGLGFSIWYPDAPPESASAQDDEFDDRSFDVNKWSWYDPVGDLQVNEDERGLILYVPGSGGGGVRGIYQQAPSPPFMIWAKVGLFHTNDLGWRSVGVTVWQNAANTSAPLWRTTRRMQATGTVQLCGQFWNRWDSLGANYGEVNDTWAGGYTYVRLRIPTTGTVYFEVSVDGVTWLRHGYWAGPGSFSHVGLTVEHNGKDPTWAWVQFFRVTSGADFDQVMRGRRA